MISTIISDNLRPRHQKGGKGSFLSRNHFYQLPLCLILILCLVVASPGYAVPDGIPVLAKVLKPIAAYGPFAFTAGGIYYSAVNGRLVVNGDYRRVVPGIISILATTLGLVGLFGDNALTVLVS